MKYLTLKKNKKRGFTLIELIIVIAILGILALILVPSMTGIVSDSRNAVNDANARAIYSAAQQAYVTLVARGGPTAVTPTSETVKTEADKYLTNIDGDYTVAIADDDTGVASITYTPTSGDPVTYPS